MTSGIEVVADYTHQVGENPLWHPREKCLYWCSVYEGGLYRYDPATGDHERLYRGDAIGGFTFQQDGSVLLFQADGAVRVWCENRGITGVVVDPGGAIDARFNDVIADPRGRVLCGTYPQDGRLGALYRLDRDGMLTELIGAVDLSNGLGFSPDRSTLYYAESQARTIHAFDYDEATGTLENQHLFATVDNEEAVPDGLTVDADGDVWSAQAFGDCVVRYDPTGRERKRYSMPTAFVTSVAFGGPDLGDLYVTTGGGEDRDENGSVAGALLRFRPGPTGREPFESAIKAD